MGATPNGSDRPFEQFKQKLRKGSFFWQEARSGIALLLLDCFFFGCSTY